LLVTTFKFVYKPGSEHYNLLFGKLIKESMNKRTIGVSYGILHKESGSIDMDEGLGIQR
jgi:hypothetical protein